jgi:type II secretory pathway pseudopilin PulG
MMRSHRGSALIAALIVIGVLALVTVATLRLASISKAQSVRDSRLLSQTSCVDASRQYLLSRLRLLSPTPVTELTFDQAVQLDSGTRHLYTGHIRPTGADGLPVGNVSVIKSVRGVASSQVGSSKANRDLSNVIGWSSLGKNYHVVVACADPVAGDMELEFTFRYGL